MTDTSNTREGQRAVRYRNGLLEIVAKTGVCERLVWPAECRDATGYPRGEWCVGCIAAEALGLPVARPAKGEPRA